MSGKHVSLKVERFPGAAHRSSPRWSILKSNTAGRSDPYRLRLITELVAWNSVLVFAWFAYNAVLGKLYFLDVLGFSILNWTSSTESPIDATLWIHRHPWIFPVLWIVLTMLLLISRTQVLARLRLTLLSLFCIPVLWYACSAVQLTGKVITSTDKDATEERHSNKTVEGSPATP